MIGLYRDLQALSHWTFTLTPSAAGREGFATAEAAMDLLPTAWSAAKRDDDISATAAARISFTEDEEAECQCHSSGRQYGRTAESCGKWQQGVSAH